jgi:3-phenylpropionate/trans-cinnamate dioxygenase ferredoxin reductase subunit
VWWQGASSPSVLVLQALPYAKPPLSKAYLCGRDAKAVTLRMAARSADSAVVIGGVPTTMVAVEPVPLQRRFGDQVGERVAKILSDNGVRFPRVDERHRDR